MLCLPDELLGHVIQEAAFGDNETNLLTDYWATEVARFALCRRIHRLSLTALVPENISLAVDFPASREDSVAERNKKLKRWSLQNALGWLAQHTKAASTVKRMCLLVCAKAITDPTDKDSFVRDIDTILEFFPRLNLFRLDMGEVRVLHTLQISPRFPATLTSLQLDDFYMPWDPFFEVLSQLSQLSNLMLRYSDVFVKGPGNTFHPFFEASFQPASDQSPPRFSRLSHFQCASSTVPLKAFLAMCSAMKSLHTSEEHSKPGQPFPPGLDLTSLERLRLNLQELNWYEFWDPEDLSEYESSIAQSAETLGPASIPNLTELSLDAEFIVDDEGEVDFDKQEVVFEFFEAASQRQFRRSWGPEYGPYFDFYDPPVKGVVQLFQGPS